MLIESANVKISNFPILFKQNSPPKQHIFSFIKKKSVSSFSRTLIKSTPARFESRARAGKERSHHVSNGTFFDWSLFVSTSDAFLSHSSGFRDLCWIRRIRFPINISPNASLFQSSIYKTNDARQRRTPSWRNGRFTFSRFVACLGDCSGPFRRPCHSSCAHSISSEKHTKTLEDSLSLSSFDQKMHFFPSPAAKKTSKKPTKRSGIPGKVLTTRITNQTRKVTTCSKAPAKRKSYCWL